jgi:hypothetical protein
MVEEEEETQKGNQGKDNSQPSFPLNQPDNNTPSSNGANIINNKNTKRNWGDIFNISDFIQILLLLVNIILLIFFIINMRIQDNNTKTSLSYTKESIDFTKRTAKESDSNNTKSLAIAESSNVITRQSMEISNTTAINQLRAYVGIDMEGQGWLQQPDGKISIDYKIVNFGQTPGKNLQIRGSIKILPTDIPKNFRPNYKIFNLIRPKVVQFPNHPLQGNIISDDIFTPYEFNEAISFKSNIRIFVFLCVVYNDVFNMERHTYFCAYLIPKSDRNKVGDNTVWMWSIAHNYNSFD